MKKGIIGIILIVVILGIIIFLLISNIGHIFDVINKWLASPTGGRVENVVSSTMEGLKELYQSFSRVMDIILYPEKVIYYEEAKPTEETVTYRYGIELETSPPPFLLIQNQDQDKAIIMSYPVLFQFKYSIPFDKELIINFTCYYKPSYNKLCFIGFYDQKDLLTSSFFGSGFRMLACQIPKMEINLSMEKCSGIVESGFYLDVSLIANIQNIETKSIYRFLVVNEKIVRDSLIKNINIYKYLGLDSSKYDTAYYTGLLDFPKIDIVRAGKIYEYPIVLFDNVSYDIIIVILRPIENIDLVENISINLDYPHSLNISYLDPVSGECKNTLNLDFGYYNLICDEDKRCIVNISDLTSFLKYKQYYSNRGILVYLPLCISNREGAPFDYAEVIIFAKTIYNYILTKDTRVYYYPSII